MKFRSIEEALKFYAEQTPDKVCIVVDNKETTYLQLYKMAHQYATFLKLNGVSKNDIVLTRASQDLRYIVTYLSIHLVGAIITSLEKSIPLLEIAKVAEQLDAKYILLREGESLEGNWKIINYSEALLLPEDDTSYDFVSPQADDSADILFTTGTTGTSKGVLLSHRALVATAENLICGCQYSSDTFMILPGPLNHANAIRKLFTTIINGSSICVLNGMTNVNAFFNALDYPIGKKACCLPPAAIRTIFALTRDRLGQYADKIDFIESASAPLPEADKLRLCSLLPNTRLYNNYGSSESASVCMYDYSRHLDKKGCIGKETVNAKVIIVDDDHNEIISNKDHMGLLACIGDMNMICYVNDPTTTCEVLNHGIVYTNDIGYKDEEGYIYISGRKGDVINVGGLKVAPSDVEEVALGMDDIDDCICIAIDDKVTGQALKLLVVLHDGAEWNMQKTMSYLAQHLENYKVPHKFELVDHIERTYNGKLNRKAYRT